MKTKSFRIFLGMIVLAIVLSMSLLPVSTVSAATIPPITLAELLAGRDVILGDKIFENFRDYATVAFNGALPVNPASVFMDFSITPTGLFQITYHSGAFFAGMNQIQDTSFAYDIRVLDGSPRIEDNTATLLAFGLGGGNLGRISIAETVTDAAGAFLAQKLIADDHGRLILSAHVQWNPPVNFITVRKDIALAGDDLPNAGAFLSEFTQEFSQTQVPEPSALLLLGAGLAGIGIIRRFKK